MSKQFALNALAFCLPTSEVLNKVRVFSHYFKSGKPLSCHTNCESFVIHLKLVFGEMQLNHWLFARRRTATSNYILVNVSISHEKSTRCIQPIQFSSRQSDPAVSHSEMFTQFDVNIEVWRNETFN